jgi:hypothetical protein
MTPDKYSTYSKGPEYQAFFVQRHKQKKPNTKRYIDEQNVSAQHNRKPIPQRQLSKESSGRLLKRVPSDASRRKIPAISRLPIVVSPSGTAARPGLTRLLAGSTIRHRQPHPAPSLPRGASFNWKGLWNF